MPIAPEYLHLIYPGVRFTAFLYGRASRVIGHGRSVGDQLGEGRELCDAHGWPVVGEFDGDVGSSASRHRRRERTDFEAMLDGIHAGECRILVAWEASRYYRDLGEYVRLRNACYEANVLLCYNGSVYDLSKREDRKATARDAVDAEDEAEGIRDRNLRTHRRLISSGAPVGRVPFGYARRYDENTGELLEQYPHPTRAPLVRSMFEQFDAGVSQYSIAKWLRSEQAGAREGGTKWTTQLVHRELRCAAYAGLREHHGEVVGKKGSWDAIVPMDLYERVQERLNDPGRRTQRDSSVKHFLSHMTYCGEHGDELPRLTLQGAGSRPRYGCDEYHDTAIKKDVFEAYVEEGLLQWFQRPDAIEAFRREGQEEEASRARSLAESLDRQLSEARALATEFDEETGEPRLSALSLAGMERSLTPRIQAARKKAKDLSRDVPPLVMRLLTADDVQAAWDSLLLEQQREVVRAVVTVRLHKATATGVRKVTPGRITLSFVGSPGFRGDRVNARARRGAGSGRG
ncbi:recombinase family protein [Streptomyces sioyaensis]|uniref:recombinase family protein n=1 Tax=Streptomyces sioyaensis TaxID=67364 RepID=UPI0037D58156